MMDEQKEKEEFKVVYRKNYDNPKLWQKSIKDILEFHWLECAKRKDSIIESKDKEIERLKRYEVMWLRLKDQLRRDREQGHLQKTGRAWFLMKEFEEAKDGE